MGRLLALTLLAAISLAHNAKADGVLPTFNTDSLCARVAAERFAEHPEAISLWKTNCLSVELMMRDAIARDEVKWPPNDFIYCRGRASDEHTAYNGMFRCLMELRHDKQNEKIHDAFYDPPGRDPCTAGIANEPDGPEADRSYNTCRIEELSARVDLLENGPLGSDDALTACLKKVHAGPVRSFVDLRLCLKPSADAAR